MKIKRFSTYVRFFASIIICQLAGVVGSVFTMPAIKGWYSTLTKPSFNPPNWIFGPVWGLLFLLMGISLFLAWEKGFQIKITAKDKSKKIWNDFSRKLWVGTWREENAAAIFVLQLILNILWSVSFFGLQSPMLAYFEVIMLWFAILYTIVNFYRISKWAAYLLVPYLVWVSFAAVLNYFIWNLN